MFKPVRRFTLPFAVLFAASALVACSKKEAVPEEETERLIQPVAKIELAGAAPAANAEPRSGEQIVQAVCAACHSTGAAGAPKTGDKAAWSARLAQGYETLLKSVVNGKGAMPPKGGATDVQDIELARAVVYLANQGGASFKEPAAK